jgi:hypothetical protein
LVDPTLKNVPFSDPIFFKKYGLLGPGNTSKTIRLLCKVSG